MAATETVNVLFTDVVDSTTREATSSPAEAAQARDAHFGLLRDALERHQGTEVKNLGDGIMATFRSAADAAAAGVAIQQGVDRQNRGATTAVGVRIGIASGDAEHHRVEDGRDEDWFGVPVIEAARLCARAAAGEILATAVVRALVGRLGKDWIDRGDLTLKGLPDPVPTYQVPWAPLDESNDAVVPLPARLAANPAIPHVGRQAQLDRLGAAWTDARAGVPSVILVGGEPGIGKTRLATELARTVLADGGTVLYGRSDEDLTVPHQPWVEALSHLVVHAPDAVLDQHLATSGGELARLVPSLNSRRPDLPPPVQVDERTGLYLAMNAAVDLLRTTGATTPVLLVLDDLHWADRASLLLLRHVAQAETPLPLLVVGTYRDTGVGENEVLADALAALHREPVVHRVALDGLTEEDVAGLLRAAAGHPLTTQGRSLARALHAETGGNPFFTAEVLRHLAETGAITRDADGRWSAPERWSGEHLPTSVREVVGRRAARLGPEVRELLEIAAVIGRDFDVDLLATVSGRDTPATFDALEPALAGGLVEEVRGRPGSLTFAHALIAHALYDEQRVTRRARLHTLIAEALERRHTGAADPSDDPTPVDALSEEQVAELARHWSRAPASARPGRALELAERAGALALATAPDDAVEWYGRALELWAESTRDPRLESRLLVGLGSAQARAGVEGSRETLIAAARRAEQLGATDLVVAAALAPRRTFPSDIGEVDHERVALLERALDLVDAADGADRATLLAALAVEITYAGDAERRLGLCRDAVTMARRVGEPATVARVIDTVFSAYTIPETFEERAAMADECLAAARRTDDPARHAGALVTAGYVAHERGNGDEVRSRFDEAIAVSHQLRDPAIEWIAQWLACQRAIMDGDIGRAEGLAADILEFGERTWQPDTMVMYGAYLLNIRAYQGRADEIIPAVEALAADRPAVPAFGAAAAVLLAEVGRVDDAARLLDQHWQAGFDRYHRHHGWFSTVLNWGVAASAVGHLDACRWIRDKVAPYGDRWEYNGLNTVGSVADVLGRLATALGDLDDAESLLHAGLRAHRAFPYPMFVARSLLHLAWLAEARADAAESARWADELERYASTTGVGRYRLLTAELRTRLGEAPGGTTRP